MMILFTMFLKLGLDLSHGSMAAMKHLLLIYLPEATFSYLLAYDDMIYDYFFMHSMKTSNSSMVQVFNYGPCEFDVSMVHMYPLISYI
jgi:hypothetical protein